MPTLSEVVVHDALTNRSQYQYQFTPKHHGADPDAAQWRPTLTLEAEFGVFNTADEREIADDVGRLYGVLSDGGDGLVDLGTWYQQVAEFPRARKNEAWHGYPIWAVNAEAPPNRSGEHMKPSKAVFERLEQARLITREQRKRLWKGRHA